ncbi:hypothetical protein SISNIDRAFT_493374 [Sistotremastrum niveocremeum HHB9708]|uniref:BTB domain-containing protein n=1 Tax=Sistotremastrum niveocremeum HHB9708 TaxID=1314777 RepID=A0A164YQX7_9AGAM|nr:hypothetical protein SISNIDRAFT_493374 [Sistotremastrum niveocremeum HHB9708]
MSLPPQAILTPRKRAASPEEPPFSPSKRLRQTNVRHHPAYYFQDGNVILQLRDVQFRVHFSQLCRKSQFFEELRESQLADSGTDGVQLFVSEEDPRDFEALLTFLYDGMTLVESPTLNFATLEPLIRAATKYRFTSIREWAITKLEKVLPTTLEDFHPSVDVEKATAAILLARQCDIPSILKPAFYRMIRSEKFTLEYAPGSDRIETGNFPVPQLSRGDILLAANLSRVFTSQWFGIATSVPSPRCPNTSSSSNSNSGQRRTECNKLFINLWWSRVVKNRAIFHGGAYDPLTALDQLIAMDWTEQGVCADCLKSERENWMKEKRRIWNDMDRWMTELGATLSDGDHPETLSSTPSTVVGGTKSEEGSLKERKTRRSVEAEEPMDRSE